VGPAGKESGRPVWKLAGLPAPHPVTTAFTIGLGDEREVRRKARQALDYPLLKLKVDADRHVDLVRVVEAHSTAHIMSTPTRAGRANCSSG
jgi:L-alanine-DL-glutamate epimerase-like enolase superfamily enzyme